MAFRSPVRILKGAVKCLRHERQGCDRRLLFHDCNLSVMVEAAWEAIVRGGSQVLCSRGMHCSER
jgi:hypothetical protein